MSTPKLDVAPGWRGTDPDGGTWVRRPADAMSDWIRYDREGVSSWRSQEQAEEASLVPLVAETNLKSLQNDRDGWRSEALAARFHEAAPAPLDPGNPEHLRQVADALLDDANTMVADSDLCRAMHTVEFYLRGQADRLDREQRESEQDRKDRELAVEIAKTQRHDFGLLAESYREEILRHILAGLRAGRAERQEAVSDR